MKNSWAKTAQINGTSHLSLCSNGTGVPELEGLEDETGEDDLPELEGLEVETGGEDRPELEGLAVETRGGNLPELESLEVETRGEGLAAAGALATVKQGGRIPDSSLQTHFAIQQRLRKELANTAWALATATWMARMRVQCMSICTAQPSGECASSTHGRLPSAAAYQHAGARQHYMGICNGEPENMCDSSMA